MWPDLEASVQVGEVLANKYRVERVLGVGGMGVVVAATHLQLGQMVALKFIRRQAMTNPELTGRFEREARAAACIRSEHVARTIDVGQLETGSPYIVMEYLEGQDLHTVLQQHGKLPVAVACDFVIQACEALAEAHSMGIVHRDLKPGNLFLANLSQGRRAIKVLDFGISKSLDPSSDPSMTRTQDIMGSPGYMSPEQMRSAKNVDGRSDLWSLGIILYELVTGERPFVAETLTALCFKIATEQPAPLPALLALDPAFDAIMRRTLEKDPNLRFQSAAELARALAPFATPESAALAFRLLDVATAISSPPGPGSFSAQRVTTLNAAAAQSQVKPVRHGRSRTIVFGAVAIGVAVAIAVGIGVTRGSGDKDSAVAPAANPRPDPQPVSAAQPPGPGSEVARPAQPPSPAPEAARPAQPTAATPPAGAAPTGDAEPATTRPQGAPSAGPDPAQSDGSNATERKKPTEPAQKPGKRTKPRDKGKPAKDSFDPFGSPD
jgi:serine/threonine-protein kinase